MTPTTWLRRALLTALTFASIGSAPAALVDRGGGMIYDDSLNITWLQDANYAKTSGYDTDGRMSWSQANTWAATLVYAGYDDWRLPHTAPVGTDWNYSYSRDGTTDVSYNIVSQSSELTHLYYVTLGLKGYFSADGSIRSDFGIFGDGSYGGQTDVGLILNLQSSGYWSGTVYSPDPSGQAWNFQTDVGIQSFNDQVSGNLVAWAVRDGDVTAAIPEPGSFALIALGLFALGTRRGRQALIVR